jgi:hypothetical protein
MYQQPSGSVNEVAVLKQGTVHNDLFDWEIVNVSSIDNKNVMSLFNEGINVLPGRHIITSFIQYNRSLLGHCPCEAFVDIEADLVAGKTYVIKMKEHGSKIEVWLEDESNGKVVSVKGIGSYRQSPMPTTIYTYKK